MSKYSESRVPWQYLVVSCLAVALLSVVLPACDDGITHCSSGDELCVDVYELTSGVLVPTCFDGPIGGPEAGCSEDHYHGAYTGFSHSGGGYVVMVDVADPAPSNCGQGNVSDVQSTEQAIEISGTNLDDYVAAEGSACW